MMLKMVREELKNIGPASVAGLTAALATDRESVEAAVAYWVNRGDLRVCDMPVGCDAGCSGCAPDARREFARSEEIIYEWIGAGSGPAGSGTEGTYDDQ